MTRDRLGFQNYLKREGLVVFGVFRSPPGDHNRGIHKIKHVIINMQDNCSCDSYFGTCPVADGIPMKRGHIDEQP